MRYMWCMWQISCLAPRCIPRSSIQCQTWFLFDLYLFTFPTSILYQGRSSHRGPTQSHILLEVALYDHSEGGGLKKYCQNMKSAFFLQFTFYWKFAHSLNCNLCFLFASRTNWLVSKILWSPYMPGSNLAPSSRQQVFICFISSWCPLKRWMIQKRYKRWLSISISTIHYLWIEDTRQEPTNSFPVFFTSFPPPLTPPLHCYASQCEAFSSLIF